MITKPMVGEEVQWSAVRGHCLLKDLGKQRCRLPLSLISSLNVSIGSYVSIRFNTCQLICRVFLWKDQPASIFQVDETVSLGRSQDISCRLLRPTAFKILKVTPVKQMRVVIVFKNNLSLRRFNNDRQTLLGLIVDALTTLAVVSGCVVELTNSPVAQLLGLQQVMVTQCRLAEDCVGLVSSKTTLTVDGAFTKTHYDAVHRLDVDQPRTVLGGLDRQRQLLEDVINLPFNNRSVVDRMGITTPKGVLVIGPCGTGKTSLVRGLSRDCKAGLVELSGPCICRSQPGETSRLLAQLFRQAVDLSGEGRCVLFIDELDSLFASKETVGHGKLLVTQLITLMDEAQSHPNLVIIGVTNKPDMLDASLRRSGRFDYEVYVGIPTLVEREDILRKLTSKFCMSTSNIECLARMTHGYVGADLHLLCQEVLMSKIANKEGRNGEDLVFEPTDFEKALKLVRPSTQRSVFAAVDLKAVSWNDIGGLEETKLQLKQSVEWPMKCKASFERLGISYPKGILLYGPPGCCKTTLVRAVATACSASFFSASAAQIYSPLVGDSEKAIVELFHQGRVSAPSIIFLDEIDSIVGRRCGEIERSVHEKVLSTLLNEMDGIGIKISSKTVSSGSERDGEVVVIAATNRPDLLDEAILRPGRFDRIIYVPPPDEAGREQILRVLTSKMPIVDFNAKRFAEQTVGFTGADLENFCREAALYALTTDGIEVLSINNRHFEEVLKVTQPSLNEELIAHFHSQITKLEPGPVQSDIT